MNTIIANETQLNKIPEGWYKDENAVYVNSVKSTPTKIIKEKSIPATTIQSEAKAPTVCKEQST